MDGGHEKAGVSYTPASKLGTRVPLLGKEQIPRTFDRFGDPPLFFGRQVGVFTRKDLSGVGSVGF